MSVYREQLETWLKSIDVKANSVLDVGGGQLLVKDRVKSWEVKDYKILDNDAQYKPDVFADINQPMTEELKQQCIKFDVIFCLEVAEYLWNPLQAHQNLYGLLKDDGVVYISYPTIYPLHNPPLIDYIRYSKNVIKKLLTETGFSTWEITPRIATNGVNALHDFYVQEGMHPMKNTLEIYDIGYCVKCFKK